MTEAPKYTGYFKIVQPQPTPVVATDSFASDGSAFNSTTWYQRLMGGSSSRISRYMDYEKMNMDIDISRAMDLVAEEMTTKNEKTRLPLDIELNNDDGRANNVNLIPTLRVALRHWCKIHNFSTSLFHICRKTILFGDLFFRRVKVKGVDTWQYINPRDVVAALVDEYDTRLVLAYQIRIQQNISTSLGPGQPVGGSSTQSYQSELVSANDIVRFTLTDNMSDLIPFGESVLSSVFRAQRQKELLEDAIVIYRIQRAPERRVFYIDVGKMQPHRTKVYLEQIKNDMRQKKVPALGADGSASIDSTYNPHTMSEDFFFASRPGGAGNRVETLPAGQNLGELTDLEYFRSKVLEGLRIPPSFMPNMQTNGVQSVFNDGQVGTAYMPEIQFYKYICRLQAHLNTTLDTEFKKFLKSIDVNIDESLYNIVLPESTNFDKYKQAAVDSSLLQQFGNADGVSYLSKRFILSRYLRLTPDEIAMNETLLSQERGLTSKEAKSLVTLYNEDMMDIDANEGKSMNGAGMSLDTNNNISSDDQSKQSDDEMEQSSETSQLDTKQ